MYQSITIVGRVGQDPEMRYTGGNAVTNFSVATDRQYTDANGERVKETTWFRVSVWGKQAEACNSYVSKGKFVLVEGRLQCDPKTGGPRIYDRQDGSKGASFEITASSVRFLSSPNQSQASAANAPDEDIPF